MSTDPNSPPVEGWSQTGVVKIAQGKDDYKSTRTALNANA